MTVHENLLSHSRPHQDPEIPVLPEDHPPELIYFPTLLSLLSQELKMHPLPSLSVLIQPTEAAGPALMLASASSGKLRPSHGGRLAPGWVAHSCSCFPASLGRAVHKLQPQPQSSVAHSLAPGPATSCQLLSASME